MHAIDINAGDYTGSFNMREDARTGDRTVSGFSKANGGRAYPRTRSLAHTTDCLVTRADGSQYRIPKSTRKGATRKARAATTVATRAPEAATMRQSSYDARHALTY